MRERDGLAQRGTWRALLVSAVFAVACTRGGPHPEPPSPLTPGSAAGTGAAGTAAADAGPVDSEGEGGSVGGGGGGGRGAAAGSGDPPTGAAGGVSPGQDDCSEFEDAGLPCDEDAGALR